MNLLDILLAASRTPIVAVAAVDAYAAYVEAFVAEDAARPRCRRCDGAGHLREYGHVAGGICFACGGQPFRAAVPMTRHEWLAEQAHAAGFDGFDVMVQE